MGMRLTPKQLREIADKVGEIEGLKVDVKVFAHEEHDIYLNNTAGGIVVVGITNRQKEHQEGTTR